jgi:hypothetical protein
MVTKHGCVDDFCGSHTFAGTLLVVAVELLDVRVPHGPPRHVRLSVGPVRGSLQSIVDGCRTSCAQPVISAVFRALFFWVFRDHPVVFDTYVKSSKTPGKIQRGLFKK